jgi:hypothetical protein
MKRWFLVVSMVVYAAVAAAGVATAAPSGDTQAQVLGNVQVDAADPTVGHVTVRYVCQAGAPSSTAAGHLWVSVKQTASRLPDARLKEESSSAVSAAWSQSHPTEQVVCDGQWHTDTFTVDHAEQGFGALQQGQAYLQFCLFGGDGTYAASQRFAAVR